MIMKKALPIIRRVVQVLTLFVFVFMVAKSLFLIDRISPLTGIVSSIAVRTFVISVLFYLPVIVLTIVFGRVFCGWICPLGTLNHFISYIRLKLIGRYKSRNKLNKPMSKMKYVILGIILIASLFGVQLAGWTDPMSIFTRSTAIVLLPGIQYPVNEINDAMLNGYDKEKDRILELYREEKITKEERSLRLKSTLQNIKRHRDFRNWILKEFFYTKADLHFENAFIHIITFVIILLLNLVAYRFWCNYLCPLGGLLALLSKFSIFRVKVNTSKCTSCRLCENACCGACDPQDEDKNIGECLACFNCLDECKEGAISVGFAIPKAFERFKKNKDNKPSKSKTIIKTEAFRNTRRQVTKSVIGGLGAVGVIALTGKLTTAKSVRPPGVENDEEFLSKCIRCGMCVRTCPTNYIQLSLLETGINGLLSPICVTGKGYCEFNCNECGKVCPTHAIPLLSLGKKQKMKLGVAVFDRNRCIPWAKDTNCIVCEEHCPVTPKAIYLKDFEIETRNRNKIIVQRPFVDSNLCIGCGVCSYKCIAESKPAINVYPL